MSIAAQTPIEGSGYILIKGLHRTYNKAVTNKDGVVYAADFAIFAQNRLKSSIAAK